jgi:hypothetical protein
MLPRHDKLKYVIGNPADFSRRPLRAFAPEVRAFLVRLSQRILADAEIRALPDVVAFAYWCRKGNIEHEAASYDDGALRLGRGVAFHIPPSNIPVNFAFSWVFSLLAGNSNILRVPNRDLPQSRVLLRHIGAVLGEEQFQELASMNVFVNYGHEEEITASLSALCDVRLIWGGDEAIRHIRKAPLPLRAVDVVFSDRYSFCVLGAGQVLSLAPPAFERLISGFYNDTYLMDQNACSSPRLVVWLGSGEEAQKARERFWTALQAEVARRYKLSDISAVDKFTQVCRDAIELDCLTDLERADNGLYRLRLDALFAGIENRRGNCGYFYEYITDDLDDIAPIITSRYQTLTYLGVAKEMLASFVAGHRMIGIDRIVPVGVALDIGLVWDGYDLIRTLSRFCHVR